MKLLRSLSFSMVFVLAPTLWADGVAGTWSVTMETPMGSRTSELAIVESAGGHKGTLSGPRGSVEIDSIDVVGEAFSFSVNRSTPMGDFTMVYRGSVDGDAMSGAVEGPRGNIPFAGTRR